MEKIDLITWLTLTRALPYLIQTDRMVCSEAIINDTNGYALTDLLISVLIVISSAPSVHHHSHLFYSTTD